MKTDRYGKVAPPVRFSEVDTGTTIETRTHNGPDTWDTPLSYLRCSECGDLLDFGECATHGPLDPFEGREGQPEFNGAFDRW